MPLFGSARDASFMRLINREMIQRISGIEVAIYKIATSETNHNIYDETTKKVYYNPVRLYTIITEDDIQWNANDTGNIEGSKTVKFAFLRDDLVDLNLVMEVSDIIKYDNKFFAIDNIIDSQYWWGRNPTTLIGQVEGEYSDFGYSVSVIAETHMTSISNLNIVETNAGVNPVKRIIPRNL